MNRIALARTYRPKNLSEVVGQDAVVQPITHALHSLQLHHAYMFSGTRGVGKTSIARILVKCLNCETKITATPCNQCATCIACDEGSFIDFIELDAASHSKVEEIRDILEQVPYPPQQGRRKVILLDEVHMLTKHSFNALLKTIEEPPEYLFFIFATTELDAVPETIRSRCLLFHFQSVSHEELIKAMGIVLSQEQVIYREEALSLIAEAASGSIRDGLSILETAISASGKELDEQSVQSVLGPSPNKMVSRLFLAIVKNDPNILNEGITLLEHFSGEAVKIIDEIIVNIQQVSLQKITTKNTSHPLAPVSNKLLQVLLQIAIETRKNVNFYPNSKVAVKNLMCRLMITMNDWQEDIPTSQTKNSETASLNILPNNSSKVTTPLVQEAMNIANVTLLGHEKRV